MAQSKSKIRVAVELKNGDIHRIECSSIEYDSQGIELWGVNTNICFGYEDISLMRIFIDNEQSKDKLTFSAVQEPKVEREK